MENEKREVGTKEALRKDLNVRINRAWRHEAANRMVAGSLTALSIVLSVAAGIMVSTPLAEELTYGKWLVAAIAALPGLLISINRALLFETRAQWAWRRASLLEAILRRFDYEQATMAEISREYSEAEHSLVGEWILYGDAEDGKHRRPPTATRAPAKTETQFDNSHHQG